MRESVKEFVRLCLSSFNIQNPIYEFGSYGGDVRSLFSNYVYIGTDMREGPGVDKILNLHNIDLPSESVGTVVILDTIEHVEYPREAMKEIYRILKDDGIIIMTSHMNFDFHPSPNDYWRFTIEGFQSLLKPFTLTFVDFSGKEKNPHLVVGIGFKDKNINQNVISNEFMRLFNDIKVRHEKDNG